ncbi:hypothetical protein AALO_G00075690 [Alosa alosa]|uniref:Uncharacterized protein n=1 Tax=Alosa alosa TaxID=278164 RepID=A0AAV6H0W0_9TELE|nr:tyrosine-protein kinase ABL1 isoform X1 [Alosa alosa]KAG5279247.1 hypothetical protein AALO_G00075690 [Alosa alosa]
MLINMRAVGSETDTGNRSDAQQDTAPANETQLFSIMTHSQQGRMEEQRCALEHKRTSPSLSCSDGTADQRPPDQQASLTLFAGSQGIRMDKKRYPVPQIVLTPGSPAPGRRACSRPASPTQEDEEDLASATLPRSATCPGSDTVREGLQQSNQESSSGGKEQLFSMVSHSQRGRMEEQRCDLQRTNRTPPASNNSNTNHLAQNPDDFFKMVASSQSRRLDDQRVCMRSLPGIQPPSGCSQPNKKVVTPTEPHHSDNLCKAVSRAQRFRMDEQRCSAPAVVMMLGSDRLARKTYSRPASPTLGLPEDCKPPKRSSSFNVSSELESAKSSTQGAEQAAVDQEKFFTIMKHSQRGRMDEQRCSLNPRERSSPVHTSSSTNKGQDPDSLFKLLTNSQNRRLDDQRATLSPLPSPNVAKKNAAVTAHQLCESPRSPGSRSPLSRSPATHRKARSRPTSPTQAEASHRPPPRSTTFCPVSDQDKKQYLGTEATQVTFQVSMSFTPQQIRRMQENECALPEVFLTLGPPGESIRVPLSPLPSRPSSLALSPGSTPHPSGASPKRAHSRDRRPRPSSPCRAPPKSSPISPDEDYFSLIQRVHSTQIQKAAGRGESGRGKGKGDGRKEGREGAKKKR